MKTKTQFSWSSPKAKILKSSTNTYSKTTEEKIIHARSKQKNSFRQFYVLFFSVISDMDLDFGMIQDNSWETHPTGFERPRNKFHDYSAEERNYPLYGTNQDNLSTTRVDIQDDWLEPSSPGNTRSSFESGRTQFDLLPNGFNSRETSNENYVYEKNNFDYENSFEDNGDSLKMY